jgi:hypothetical protein
MPLAGSQLKPRMVATLLWDEGWVNAENLMIMVAVTGAESNYFTEAYNHNPPTEQFPNGTTDWGLYQLNDGGKTGQALQDFKSMAFDPLEATHYARQLYVNRSFSPWVAYKNGSWENFIPQATVAICNMLRERYDVPLL